MADSNKKTKFDFKVSKMRLIWYNTRLYQALFYLRSRKEFILQTKIEKKKNQM